MSIQTETVLNSSKAKSVSIMDGENSCSVEQITETYTHKSNKKISVIFEVKDIHEIKTTTK
jgi:hypothetical protein